VPDSPREIRWLKRALANLDAEAAFIARDDPAAARVVEAIATTVELLA
jgi:toxin ParE1/3/4